MIDINKLSLVEIEDFEHQYIALLRSGMMFEFYPKFSGQWIKDRQEFIDDLVKNNAQNKYQHLQKTDEDKLRENLLVIVDGDQNKLIDILDILIKNKTSKSILQKMINFFKK
jgi:hypothetical protein